MADKVDGPVVLTKCKFHFGGGRVKSTDLVHSADHSPIFKIIRLKSGRELWCLLLL